MDQQKRSNGLLHFSGDEVELVCKYDLGRKRSDCHKHIAYCNFQVNYLEILPRLFNSELVKDWFNEVFEVYKVWQCSVPQHFLKVILQSIFFVSTMRGLDYFFWWQRMLAFIVVLLLSHSGVEIV